MSKPSSKLVVTQNTSKRGNHKKYGEKAVELTKDLDGIIIKIKQTSTKNFNKEIPDIAKSIKKLKNTITKLQSDFKKDVASMINHSNTTDAMKNSFFSNWNNNAKYKGRIDKNASSGKYRVIIHGNPQNDNTIISIDKFDSFITAIVGGLINKKVNQQEANEATKQKANEQKKANQIKENKAKNTITNSERTKLINNLEKVRRNISNTKVNVVTLVTPNPTGQSGVNVRNNNQFLLNSNKKKNLREFVKAKSQQVIDKARTNPLATKRNLSLINSLRGVESLNTIPMTTTNHNLIMRLL
jgi:hypothetical protein